MCNCAVNDPPTGSLATQFPDGTEEVPYEMKVSDLLNGFTDPDIDDVLSVVGLSADPPGEIDMVYNATTESYIYTPVTDSTGSVTFSYYVSDLAGEKVAAGFTIAFNNGALYA